MGHPNADAGRGTAGKRRARSIAVGEQPGQAPARSRDWAPQPAIHACDKPCRSGVVAMGSSGLCFRRDRSRDVRRATGWPRLDLHRDRGCALLRIFRSVEAPVIRGDGHQRGSNGHGDHSRAQGTAASRLQGASISHRLRERRSLPRKPRITTFCRWTTQCHGHRALLARRRVARSLARLHARLGTGWLAKDLSMSAGLT